MNETTQPAQPTFLDKHLIDGWRAWWKMYSIWFFAALGMLPEIYNLAISSGFITAEEAPKFISRIISGVAFFGAVSRLLKQKTVEQAAAIAQEKRADTEQAS